MAIKKKNLKILHPHSQTTSKQNKKEDISASVLHSYPSLTDFTEITYATEQFMCILDCRLPAF